MKIHAIQTGTVQIHTRQVVGVGNGLGRTLNTIRDTEWTPPLAIRAWAIEHPEGVIVVDTGDTARASGPNYHPRFHPFYRWAVRYFVKPEDEIGPQLQKIGISTSDVRTVIMTHLHSDHSGGLHHFPKSEIWVHPGEYAASQGIGGYISGYLSWHFPEWFKPKPIELTSERFGVFPQSQRVTKAGDVVIVPTYGHTPNHVSVIVREDGKDVFLAGDTSYTEKNLVAGVVDGVTPKVEQTAGTMRAIVEYARSKPTVYLPTHDPDAEKRLANRTVLTVKQ